MRSHTTLLTEKKVVNYNPKDKKKDSANDASFTLLLKLTFNGERTMKKTLLALATTLLLPNMSYAAACADGANAAGCTIGTLILLTR